MNEDNKFRFDLWLYNQMQKYGYNAIDVADKTGISPQTINHYLRDTRMPTLRTLAVLLKAFNMHLEIVEN